MQARRQFMFTLLPLGIALVTAGQAVAQAAKVDESDAAARGIGYRHDASKVDAAKFPSHAKGRLCSGCALYQGKQGEAWGACPIVAGKLVNANGWCTAWVKKA